ncbi:nuclear intron maturase 1, mitochondrial [Silene latifolia]|uniref:nuclear intron maturase 1, mitochondrial n=1 Tax=Silene latifolia TaxID=37657 RepID=UPI003D77A7C3
MKTIMSLRTLIKHLPCKRWFLRTASISSASSSSSNTETQSHQHQHQHQHNPIQLMKQDPIEICSEIWVKSFSTSKTKPFSNLTGFLSKFDLWVLAYQRIVAESTGSFPSRNAIHSQVLHDLLSLRNAVLKGNFNWNMRAHLYIHAPNQKPITQFTSKKMIAKLLESNAPLFQDRIVQEVLFFIVEPVFEPRFSSKSHAFRPGRNAHTVIRTIRSNFAGYLWYLRGDLSELLEKVDKSMVMNCLQKLIKDKRVLGLIKSALHDPPGRQFKCSSDSRIGRGNKMKKKKKGDKRKVLNPNEAKPDPYWLRTFYSFAPEEAAMVPNYGYCGILSPLLANVCLNELDQMIENRIEKFFKPSNIDMLWNNAIDSSVHNPAWPEFVPSERKDKTRKMDYIRYGGHFLIGIRGSREEAVEMKRVLIEFCENNFGIELDNSKVGIEHVSRGIQFLDHVISHRIIYPTLHYTATGGVTVSKKGVGTLLSVTASLPRCIRQFRRLELLKGDKDPEPLPCTPMLYSSQAHTNSQMNKFLETMADWYKYADNRKKAVGFCAYVIRSSLAKLYASRYKLKSRAKVYGIASRDLRHSLRGKGRMNSVASEYSDLVRLGVADPIEGVQFSHMSLIPSCDYTPFPRVWVPEHEQVFLEYIKLQDPKYFCELLTSVKAQGLNLPQDDVSKIVWDFKTLGVRRFCSESERHP